MRTFLLTDKTNSNQEIIGKLHTSGINFRKIKAVVNGGQWNCYAIEATTKKEQKLVLSLARETGNLSGLVAIKSDLSVQKGQDIIGKFSQFDGLSSDNHFIDGENLFKVIQ